MQKTAIVTGAAKNIGKGIATTLLQAGYECILLDNNNELLEETVAELQKIGQCREYVANVGDINALEQFCLWLKEQDIKPNVLINNVGYDSAETFLELTPNKTQLSNQTNLDGPFLLASQVAQMMIAQKTSGNIVFISSVHSKITRYHPLYSAAKAAIEMFVKEAALELGPHRIRVNAIAPGPVKDTPELSEREYVPLGYNLQPKDIGEAVAFLVSDKARFITGQTLVVDGGFSLPHTHHWIKQNKVVLPPA
jgi:NAD(P)-dependent dehydrogenase (short-subunit alcohol dehydrogenase family)